jgi:surface-adhesin protein E
MPFTIRPYRRFLVYCGVTYNAGPFLKPPKASFVGLGSLMMFLLLSSGPAYAEWVAIGSSESLGGYTVYVDPDTIRHKGDLVKVWALTDYTTIQTVADLSFLSSKAQNEFDCTEERQRELSVTWFSSNMGKGNGIWTNSDETPWRPVAPGSVGQGVWDFACACAIIPCRTQPVTEPKVRHER